MKKHRKKRRGQGTESDSGAGSSGARSPDEGAYTCPSCGEEIVIPLDVSAGSEQEYVEDCPVCCNPNVIHVEFFEEGEPARVWAEAE